LAEDEWLDASGIEVLVKDGEVTLNGQVDNRLSKRRVEDISESVSGVQHVQNNIRSSREVSIK
jgi:osmotically-inducible protein OsmY